MKYLIVDDDPDCCLLLNDLLSEFGRGHCFHDGNEAVVAVKLAVQDGTPYDLICLDIVMPKLSGHDTLKAIRAVEDEYGIGGLDRAKVVMTTSMRDKDNCLKAFNAGCESYIVKPVNRDELLVKTHELGLSLA